MASQRIHFISIGGSSMHNLAIALNQQGYEITGSDDALYDPSKARLQEFGLVPPSLGWFPERIHSDLDAVIVGMHAGENNPEIQKALTLGLPVYSYPEFIYQQSQQKQRIVIAGSHGKTTITAIILHVLKFYQRTFDYWIGEPIDGFDSTVRLTSGKYGDSAPIIIVEADEYASSPIDSRPKFLAYQPHIALINGIAWDHVSTYPTWDSYVETFESLAESMPKAGLLLFDESDDMLDIIGHKDREDITKIPYMAHPSVLTDEQVYLVTKRNDYIPTHLFGNHNMKNVSGAMTLCDRIGITAEQFYQAIPSFEGIRARLERIHNDDEQIIYRDIAQSPATVKATVEAVKTRYPNKLLYAVLEINPTVWLNDSFLSGYKDTFQQADSIIIFSEKMVINLLELASAFNQPVDALFHDQAALKSYLLKKTENAVLLIMSAENLNNLDIHA